MSYDADPDFDEADDRIANDIPRDEWRRPRIYPKPKGKEKSHADVVANYQRKGNQPGGWRRVTKFIAVIDDRYNIERWAERMVALGAGQREDLVHAASSLTADVRDRDDLQTIATKMKNHARADSKATKGTATHKLCERIDSGEQLDRNQIPKAVVADLDAYVRTRDAAGIKYNLIERLRVFDEWRIAGTPDRTGFIDGQNAILDLKTGDLDYSEPEIAMQLAVYAYSTPYTQAEGRVPDDPPVRCDKAYVIHLPTGEAKCDLYEVDIQRGWERCKTAQKVWETRKDKYGFFLPYKLPPIDVAAKLAAAATDQELVVLWNMLPDEQRDARAFAQRATELRLA